MKESIQEFCNANGIENNWDFQGAKKWTEIYINGKMLFQFGESATTTQFIEVVQSLSRKFEKEDIETSEKPFWFYVGSESNFQEFTKAHGHLFNVNHLRTKTNEISQIEKGFNGKDLTDFEGWDIFNTK